MVVFSVLTATNQPHLNLIYVFFVGSPINPERLATQTKSFTFIKLFNKACACLSNTLWHNLIPWAEKERENPLGGPAMEMSICFYIICFLWVPDSINELPFNVTEICWGKTSTFSLYVRFTLQVILAKSCLIWILHYII